MLSSYAGQIFSDLIKEADNANSRIIEVYSEIDAFAANLEDLVSVEQNAKATKNSLRKTEAPSGNSVVTSVR